MSKKCLNCEQQTHEIGLISTWDDFLATVVKKYEVGRLRINVCVNCNHLLHFYDNSKFLGAGRGIHRVSPDGKFHIEWKKFTK